MTLTNRIYCFDTGFIFPGSVVDGGETSTFGKVWNNPSNAVGDNNVYASVVSVGGNNMQNSLFAKNFNFTLLPDDAIIEGIEVVIERYESGGSNDFYDYSMYLTLNGSNRGANAVSGINYFPTSQNIIKTFGGPHSMWGTSLTVGDIKSSTFGIKYKSRNGIFILMSGNVDYIKIKIYYSIPLPIELIYFDGKMDNNIVKLEWSTASEQNNDFFTVEKSINLKDWKIMCNIKGAGNSNTIKSYIVYDKIFDCALIYYRLKQTDFDGNFVFYGPISVKINLSRLKFYMNNGHVIITNETDNDENLVMFDIVGNFQCMTIHSHEILRFNNLYYEYLLLDNKKYFLRKS